MRISSLEIERRRHGLSTTGFSKLVGVNAPAISNVEHGKLYAWPKLKSRIAEALSVDPDKIFDENGFVKFRMIE